MSDRPARDTDPCPTAVEHERPEPSLTQVLDRVEAQSSALAEAIDLVRLCLDEVRHARHAIAVVADDVLERRAEVSRLVERLDLLDADGCGRYRAHHGGGNGHG